MAFFVFILGLFIGSFLNVLADRLPKNETILGRSHCEYCKKELKWYDLIPVFSYAFIRGKCRYCHRDLSMQYPLSEISTGLLFALTFVLSPTIESLVISLIVISALVVIFFSDLRYRIIPDKVLLPTIFLVLADLFISNPNSILSHFLAALICFLFFLGIFVITRGRGMGFGDVKVAILIGLFLGIPLSFMALYLAFLTGGVVAIILILWKKKRLKSEISFGPFLVVGTLLAFFLQNPLMMLFHHYLG